MRHTSVGDRQGGDHDNDGIPSASTHETREISPVKLTVCSFPAAVVPEVATPHGLPPSSPISPELSQEQRGKLARDCLNMCYKIVLYGDLADEVSKIIDSKLTDLLTTSTEWAKRTKEKICHKHDHDLLQNRSLSSVRRTKLIAASGEDCTDDILAECKTLVKHVKEKQATEYRKDGESLLEMAIAFAAELGMWEPMTLELARTMLNTFQASAKLTSLGMTGSANVLPAKNLSLAEENMRNLGLSEEAQSVLQTALQNSASEMRGRWRASPPDYVHL